MPPRFNLSIVDVVLLLSIFSLYLRVIVCQEEHVAEKLHEKKVICFIS